MNDNGQAMYNLANRLFPIHRSIMGKGFRDSLAILKEKNPDIKVYEVPSGTVVFDWKVPKEWNISAGYIETLNNRRIIDFETSNLHIVGYSIPIDAVITKKELLKHIYTLPDQPDWIPYVTSYYKERWGFCMSEKQKLALNEEKYHVVIDSSLSDGNLTYGELVVPGLSKEEVLITTYLCHPSMANNELSGPVVWTELIRYVKSLKNRRYTYRFLINPETIGSITYLSQNLQSLKERVIAGFVLSCVGDERNYSIVESRLANTLADKVAHNVMKFHAPDYKTYSFLQRGSDERQFCSPNVNLPMCGICRTKYGEYPEYHTSADDMNLITPEGLQGSLEVMCKIVDLLENNYKFLVNCYCEPQLGKRGLFPTVSKKGNYNVVKPLLDFLAYADGKMTLVDIIEKINQPADILLPLIHNLLKEGLITKTI